MSDWEWTYEGWDPDAQPLREALCTLGNGYFATRGAAEEASAGGSHYPGTYLAGGYDRLDTEITGRVVENEDLVNWPNWLCLAFRCEGGDWFDLRGVEIFDYRQTLDMRRGLLERRLRFQDPASPEMTLTSRRLVHMEAPHLAAIQWRLVSENWSGRLEIRAALDGNVQNAGVERYGDLAGDHLEFLESGPVDETGIHLRVQSRQSRIQMAQAARVDVFQDGEPAEARRSNRTDGGWIAHHVELDCEAHQEIRVEKLVALYTSRDHAISEPSHEACRTVRRGPSFQELARAQEGIWSSIWRRCDLELPGQERAQRILRLHVFHLLQTGSHNSIDLDTGMPSRGLHGEAYRGHVFWDSLFIFPYLNLRIPQITRSLLRYRYRRLQEARRAARDAGFRGAMYPWQSGSNGREESQEIHLNPESGRWIPDETHLQRHVNSAIAYNVWRYYQATADMEFLSFSGGEMILEIAAFWSSRATWDEEKERFVIRGVVGPDEYHTRYPDADEPGIDNNAYTNVMAVWVLRCARRLLDLLAEDRRREILGRLEIDADELARWEQIERRMFVPFHGDGVISQFEGFEELQELDWEGYRERYDDIQRLDRILEAEGDSPNRYKATKQADALMLFYLFSAEELGDLFERMGYELGPDTIPATVDYYLQRTSDGSSLSRMVHCWVLARSDRERSWDYFQRALTTDVEDVQGGTTPEGIHLGAMSGTVDILQRCYTGLEMRDDVLWFNPCLPRELREMHLRIQYRGHWLSVRVTHDELHVSFDEGWSSPARVGLGEDVHVFEQGQARTFQL